MDSRHWPHAPPHWLFKKGAYFVTASTYRREKRFDAPEKLDVVTRSLVETAPRFGWTLRAWAVFSNHYHFLADSPEQGGESLRMWLRELHRSTAVAVNRMDEGPNRRVWMNFRESFIDRQPSYLARLNYVNRNAVKHGLVFRPEDYPWCSAAWFEKHAAPGFVASVNRFGTDRVKVDDDFEV